MAVEAGSAVMTERGVHGFSASEVASRIGYSVSTTTSLFGGVAGLVMAVGERTLRELSAAIRESLVEEDAATALVEAYFDFARSRPKLWDALYSYRPDEMPEGYSAALADVLEIVGTALRRRRTDLSDDQADVLTRSLLATVYGHAAADLAGTYGLGADGADALTGAVSAVSALVDGYRPS